jgi:hypothetical protein
LPQSSSASRFTAGASAFFILSQSAERPDREAEPFHLDTIEFGSVVLVASILMAPAILRLAFWFDYGVRIALDLGNQLLHGQAS